MVEGASIAYRSWGAAGGRPIVLVHGGAAHSRWWDHVAPLLVEGRRLVLAIDLSGHGDSDHRTAYRFDTWAREILAVTAAAGIAEPPVVIGHSMGGFVTLRAATLFGARLRGAVVIDSPVHDLTPEETAARERRAFGPLRVYATADAVRGRFHPVPDQRSMPFIAAHIAAHSIRQVPGGWTWKFDPHVFGHPPLSPSSLTRVDCRIALFRGEHGILSEQMSKVMYDRLGRVAPVIEIPDAGHHVMLDRPLALVSALRTLLCDWEHSRPAE